MATPTDTPAITLDASSRRVQLAVLWALGVLALAAFVVAYPGLVWVGVELAHLPAAVAFALPVVIDAGLLVLGLAAAVKRSQRRPARLEIVGLASLVGVSVVAQAAHVAAMTTAPSWLTFVGGLVAATAPLTLLLAAESALRAVLSEPARRARRSAPRTPAPTTPRAVAPKNQPTTATGRATYGQRTAAAARFDEIDGYRDVVEQYVRTGAPTPRILAEETDFPGRSTIQADALVVREGLATTAAA